VLVFLSLALHNNGVKIELAFTRHRKKASVTVNDLARIEWGLLHQGLATALQTADADHSAPRSFLPQYSGSDFCMSWLETMLERKKPRRDLQVHPRIYPSHSGVTKKKK
jgi:hypothetical protein